MPQEVSPTTATPSEREEYCFQYLSDDKFWVGELFDAVDNYIGLGFATNPSREIRWQYHGDIGSWFTNKITNMYGLFYYASSFNEPMDGWDLSSVNTTTHAMFLHASSFNQPFNGWNDNKVTGMMPCLVFSEAANFDQPLNSWNVGKTSMESMFDKTNNFNKLLDEWDVGKVTNRGGCSMRHPISIRF